MALTLVGSPLVQVTPATATGGQVAPFVFTPANTATNLLVVYVGYNLSATPTNAPTPSFNVTDSAGNLWIPVQMSPSNVAPNRGATWICPNARANTWVSVAVNGYVSNAVAVLAEFSGAPAFPHIDFAVSAGTATSVASQTVSSTATVSDYVFGINVIGNSTHGTLTPPAGYTELVAGGTSAGGSNPNTVTVDCVYNTVSAGAVSATWAVSVNAPMASVLIGISQANFAPSQPSANFPAVKVEMAFGATPADATANITYSGTPGSMVSGWTDVTVRAISKQGTAIMDGLRGRTYELTNSETGVLNIGLRNDDGAFNPQNTNSPYYPHVVLNTPVRVTAVWNGFQYNLFTGYVVRWPQDWPDMPQYGMSRLQAVDIAGVASATGLPSAVQGEILADAPYACFPFNESYTSTTQAPSGQSGGVQTVIDADGFPAFNSSRTNQRQGTYQDGELPTTLLAPVNTGQTLGLLGDSNSGMGTTAFSGTAETTTFRGPGVIYADLNSPGPGSTNGVTVEMFFNVAAITRTGTGDSTNLLNAFGPPIIVNTNQINLTPFWTLSVFLDRNTGSYTIDVLAGQLGGAVAGPNIAFPTAQLGVTQHLVVTMTSTTMNVYLNGVLKSALTGLNNLTDQIQGWSFGQAHWPYTIPPQGGNYAIQYGTIYNYQLSAARVLQHYTSGVTGFQGDLTQTRFSRYLAWSGVNFSPGSWPQSTIFPVELGAAYNSSSSSLSDSLNSLTLGAGDMWYANSAGSLVLAPRTALYNQPTAVTFGDSNTPGTEVPYLPGFGIDYDNAYLQNVVQTSQVNGPSTLSAPISKNTASVNSYGPRGPLGQTVSTVNILDAYDRLFWSLNKYDQPASRVRVMTVDAAANPALFTQCLSLDIGAAAVVNRRPLGATANYSLPVILQQVGFQVGPGLFQFGYIGTPYTAEGNALTTDTSADVLGSNVLSW